MDIPRMDSIINKASQVKIHEVDMVKYKMEIAKKIKDLISNKVDEAVEAASVMAEAYDPLVSSVEHDDTIFDFVRNTLNVLVSDGDMAPDGTIKRALHSWYDVVKVLPDDILDMDNE
jgi:hypothetical protein